MSSQASSAGRDEAKVRQKLIETGAVDIMIAIRSNFFYTRTVPCELWFLNRAKPEEYRDKVLMIDARNIYRKVTRKIYDFSPEQEQNILAIVWLYRGQTDKYLNLVAQYCRRVLDESEACFSKQDGALASPQKIEPLADFIASIESLFSAIKPFLDTLNEDDAHAEVLKELNDALSIFKNDVSAFEKAVSEQRKIWQTQQIDNNELKIAVEHLSLLAQTSRGLVKQADLLYKLVCRLIDVCENQCNARTSKLWSNREVTRCRKKAEQTRSKATHQLKQVRHFHRQASWLTERFPEARLRDVEGLVKLVDLSEIKANDWSLTPGRYVGVAPEEEDEDFDFEQALRDIHMELEELNAEAIKLAEKIRKNFEELGI